MASLNRDAFLGMVEGRQSLEDGRFDQIARLGAGGGGGHFSVLCKAVDATTRREVALKFYFPEQPDPYREASFDREARLLERLVGQPDIIQLVAPRGDYVETLTTTTSIDVTVSYPYYALELASGNVEEATALDRWDATRNLVSFRAMCRAVQRIHSLRITHRDLKPSNFLTMPNNRDLKLSDFGTARALDDGTPALAQRYNGPPGDTRYAAPELFAGLHDQHPEIAFKSDMFALGAILFELFAGEPLGLQILDAQFLGSLGLLTNIQPDRRQVVYDRVVGTIVDNRKLPSVRTYNVRTPASIRGQIDALYQSLAHLDYRRRQSHFPSVFRQIDICLLVLSNEEKYHRWQVAKRDRQLAHGHQKRPPQKTSRTEAE